MLARAVDPRPTGRACSGGCLYEPKWDGFRCIAVVDDDRGVQLGSRRSKRLNDGFPEIVTAVFEHVPARSTVRGRVTSRLPGASGPHLRTITWC